MNLKICINSYNKVIITDGGVINMTDKNNDNNGKKRKKFISRFLDKDGFYLVLLICISTVMITALWISRYEEEYFISEDSIESREEGLDSTEIHLVDKDKEDNSQETIKGSEGLKERQQLELRESPKKPINDEKIKEIKIEKEETNNKAIDKNTNIIKEKTDEVKKENNLKENKEDEKPIEKEEVSIVNKQFNYMMSQPVIGKVGLAYAGDRLVYHETLEQWRTHRGIDIHASEGTPVRAALKGRVLEIVNDTLMGITIRLEHDDDLVTVYSNLSTDAMVKVGDYVERGQVISGVGRTAAIKKEEGPLLHFQVLLSGEPVDPQLFLPRIDG